VNLSDAFVFTLMAVALVSTEAAHAEQHLLQTEADVLDPGDYATIDALISHDDVGASMLDYGPAPVAMDLLI
jgi:hypothetical protein